MFAYALRKIRNRNNNFMEKSKCPYTTDRIASNTGLKIKTFKCPEYKNICIIDLQIKT